MARKLCYIPLGIVIILLAFTYPCLKVDQSIYNQKANTLTQLNWIHKTAASGDDAIIFEKNNLIVAKIEADDIFIGGFGFHGVLTQKIKQKYGWNQPIKLKKIIMKLKIYPATPKRLQISLKCGESKKTKLPRCMMTISREKNFFLVELEGDDFIFDNAMYAIMLDNFDTVLTPKRSFVNRLIEYTAFYQKN